MTTWSKKPEPLKKRVSNTKIKRSGQNDDSTRGQQDNLDREACSLVSGLSIGIFNEVNALSRTELMDLAKQRYESLLFSPSKDEHIKDLHITISGLNEKHESELKKFCKMIKEKTGKRKSLV